MNGTTIALVHQIQQALLDLPNPHLKATIDEWLAEEEKDAADLGDVDYHRQVFGYQLQSTQTGHQYPSFEAFCEQEPDAVEYTWEAPSPDHLRALLAGLGHKQIYHGVVPCIDAALQSHSFICSFGFPPFVQGNGFFYLQQVVRYLHLKKEHASLSPDAFEEVCEEVLAAAYAAEMPPDDEDDWLEDGEPLAPLPPDLEAATTFARSLLRADERSLDFEITLSTPDTGLRVGLFQALKHLGCDWSVTEQGVIRGSLDYTVWKCNKTKAVGKLRRLLDRWQEQGRLTWSSRRLKPLKAQPQRPKRARRR